VSIYKTVGGSYVVAGVGRSTREGETDREWAQTSTKARAIIERLRLRDDDGVWYIPSTSLRVLEDAAGLDIEIYEALYAPEHID
jgi:hypothetical protein